MRALDIERRLSAVYQYGALELLKVIPKPQRIFDVGTYLGQQLKMLAAIAGESVTSMDIDPGHLWLAEHRSDVFPLLDKKIHLVLGDALGDITPDKYPDGSFDAVFLYEVLGAGLQVEESLQGARDPLEVLFGNITRILRPRGFLSFTIRSKTTEVLLKSIGWEEQKGYSVRRHVLKPLLSPYYDNITWAGQMVLQSGPLPDHPERNGIVVPVNPILDEQRKPHLRWYPDSYIPREGLDEEKQYPLFWIFRGQKKLEPIEQGTVYEG